VPAVRNSASSLGASFEAVSFDLENPPKAERKTETSKKRDGKPKAPVVEVEAVSAKAVSEGSESSRKIDKRQKEKKFPPAEAASSSSKVAGSSSKKGGKLPAEDDGEPLPSMIDLRVGHIVDGMSRFSGFISVS
jgi:aminoacyl tRNA synthase complex-interacting multifunctional protein 1